MFFQKISAGQKVDYFSRLGRHRPDLRSGSKISTRRPGKIRSLLYARYCGNPPMKNPDFYWNMDDHPLNSTLNQSQFSLNLLEG
jgi:hypothetical protein